MTRWDQGARFEGSKQNTEELIAKYKKGATSEYNGPYRILAQTCIATFNMFRDCLRDFKPSYVETDIIQSFHIPLLSG